MGTYGPASARYLGRMKKRMPFAPRCVLCQTCANYLGTGAERGRSARGCPAGVAVDPLVDDLTECASYLPVSIKGLSDNSYITGRLAPG